jgi:hypothetical protein
MASGSGLDIPRVRAACLDPFRPQTVYAGAFTLARNLLLAGIGTSEDWERSNGDRVNFMLHTVQRAAAGFNQRIIDRVAHTNIVFGIYPSSWSLREPERQNRNHLFVAVEATHISVVYLREALELLAKTDPRLPATFYRMLLDGVSQWILCYDESAVESYYEYRLESYKEAVADGEVQEGLEKPQTIENAKGPWLSRKFKPWPASNPQCYLIYSGTLRDSPDSGGSGATPQAWKKTKARSSGLEGPGRVFSKRLLHRPLQHPGLL